MKREINQELINKLRNKEIWLHYGDLRAKGDLEGLRLILKTAFPEDTSIPGGSVDYYRNIGNRWDGTSFGPPSEVAAHELEDFFTTNKVVNNYEIY